MCYTGSVVNQFHVHVMEFTTTQTITVTLKHDELAESPRTLMDNMGVLIRYHFSYGGRYDNYSDEGATYADMVEDILLQKPKDSGIKVKDLKAAIQAEPGLYDDYLEYCAKYEVRPSTYSSIQEFLTQNYETRLEESDWRSHFGENTLLAQVISKGAVIVPFTGLRDGQVIEGRGRGFEGVLYCLNEKAKVEYARDRQWREKALAYLQSELKMYSDWACGNMWMISVECDDEQDAVGGFYGSELAQDIEHIKQYYPTETHNLHNLIDKVVKEAELYL